jgi:hypothetical protein
MHDEGKREGCTWWRPTAYKASRLVKWRGRGPGSARRHTEEEGGGGAAGSSPTTARAGGAHAGNTTGELRWGRRPLTGGPGLTVPDGLNRFN